MQPGQRIVDLLLMPLFVSAAAGCVTGASELRRVETQFAFIEQGRTTRAEVVERLGTPSASYERGRLVVYIFDPGEETREAGADHPANTWSTHLVIEYREDDTVNRHGALVPP